MAFILTYIGYKGYHLHVDLNIFIQKSHFRRTFTLIRKGTVYVESDTGESKSIKNHCYH